MTDVLAFGECMSLVPSYIDIRALKHRNVSSELEFRILCVDGSSLAQSNDNTNVIHFACLLSVAQADYRPVVYTPPSMESPSSIAFSI
jgi:hypothetical protein